MSALKNHPSNPAAQPFNISSPNKTSKRAWWRNMQGNKQVKAVRLPIHGGK